MSENNLSDKQAEELKEAFADFDVEEEGSIGLDECMLLLRAVGLNPTKEQMTEYKEKLANESQKVTFEEFMQFMKTVSWDPEEEVDKLSDAFKEFDKTETGYLAISDIRNQLKTLGEDTMTDAEIEEMFNEIAPEGGKFYYRELAEVLCAKIQDL